MKVVSNTAISLDGRINTRERGFVLLGTTRDHARMSELRAEADAVLVGGATFRNWPHPSLPDDDAFGDGGPAGEPALGDVARGGGPGSRPDAAPRAARAARRPLWNVVVSRSMDVPLNAGFLAESRIRPLFLTRPAAVPPGFPAEVETCDHPGDDLPVPWMLEVLRRRGVRHLLVEAGGDLLFQFLAADALDEMHVTVCPLVIGGDTPSLAGGPGFFWPRVPRLRLLASEAVGDELFLRYAVLRDGAAAHP